MVVSAYNIKVDTIALLQTSNEIERGLFETATPGVLSVVAFSCVPLHADHPTSKLHGAWGDCLDEKQWPQTPCVHSNVNTVSMLQREHPVRGKVYLVERW